MDIYWHGQACFKIKGKSATIITDPYDPEMVGLKLPKEMDANIVSITHDHGDHNNRKAVTSDPVVVEGPGEYESNGVSIVGIPSFHDNSKGTERGKNTIFNFIVDGLNIVHMGDFGQEALTPEQVSEIGSCDILMIPVGGVYTIDGKTASEIVAQLEPRMIIPMHYKIEDLASSAYKIEGLKFELDPVDNFLKAMGVEAPDAIMKLSITKDKLPEEAKVVVMLKS